MRTRHAVFAGTIAALAVFSAVGCSVLGGGHDPFDTYRDISDAINDIEAERTDPLMARFARSFYESGYDKEAMRKEIVSRFDRYDNIHITLEYTRSVVRKNDATVTITGYVEADDVVTGEHRRFPHATERTWELRLRYEGGHWVWFGNQQNPVHAVTGALDALAGQGGTPEARKEAASPVPLPF